MCAPYHNRVIEPFEIHRVRVNKGLSRNKHKIRTLRYKALCGGMARLSCADGFDRTHCLSPLQQGVHIAGTPNVYTPAAEEILFARLHVRNDAGLRPVVNYVRSCLYAAPGMPLGCDQTKTLYRYHAVIREHLSRGAG